jgi:hypothetical protein
MASMLSIMKMAMARQYQRNNVNGWRHQWRINNQ